MTAFLAPSTDDPLPRLRAELRARRLQAEMDVAMVGGEPDVRLHVCEQGRPDLAVEVLGRAPSAAPPDHWDAVRIQHGGRRVWRGPDRGCSLDEVRRFVEALLFLGVAQLAQLYVDLG
jgi:hypothetical protein